MLSMPQSAPTVRSEAERRAAGDTPLRVLIVGPELVVCFYTYVKERQPMPVVGSGGGGSGTACPPEAGGKPVTPCPTLERSRSFVV